MARTIDLGHVTVSAKDVTEEDCRNILPTQDEQHDVEIEHGGTEQEIVTVRTSGNVRVRIRRPARSFSIESDTEPPRRRTSYDVAVRRWVERAHGTFSLPRRTKEYVALSDAITFARIARRLHRDRIRRTILESRFEVDGFTSTTAVALSIATHAMATMTIFSGVPAWYVDVAYGFDRNNLRDEEARLLLVPARTREEEYLQRTAPYSAWEIDWSAFWGRSLSSTDLAATIATWHPREPISLPRYFRPETEHSGSSREILKTTAENAFYSQTKDRVRRAFSL